MEVGMRKLFLVLLGLLLAAPAALAVDYQKIDRKLAKEPAYSSGKPRYALLLFGREAALRAWAVLDGDALYLDRNGDGDLTGKDERFATRTHCKDVTLLGPDGKTKYVITSVGGYEDKKTGQTSLMVNVTVEGPVKYRQYCDVVVRDSPAKAGVAHFDGPLTAQPITVYWKLPPGLALKLGNEENDVRLLVGTLDEKAGCWTVVRTHEGEKSAFGPDIHPRVEIAWPAAASAGPPITQQITLKQFC
jgi:hypothetical protein